MIAAPVQSLPEKSEVEKSALEPRTLSTNGSPSATITTPSTAADAKFQLVAGAGAPRLAPAPPAPRHLPLRPLVALVIVVGAGVAIGWAVTTTGWTPPWVQPPGRLTPSATLEADEVLVGSQLSARILD